MIDLTKIQARLGSDFRVEPRFSDKTEGTHRYKAGDTVQGKDGRDYYILMPVWSQFRWAPLTPCYLFESNNPFGCIADDYEFW